MVTLATMQAGELAKYYNNMHNFAEVNLHAKILWNLRFVIQVHVMHGQRFI